MSTDEARAIATRAFGIEPDELPEDARLGETEGWDSLGHMRLVLAVEERLGRLLSPDEIVSLRSTSAVVALLASATKPNTAPRPP